MVDSWRLIGRCCASKEALGALIEDSLEDHKSMTHPNVTMRDAAHSSTDPYQPAGEHGVPAGSR